MMPPISDILRFTVPVILALPSGALYGGYEREEGNSLSLAGE